MKQVSASIMCANFLELKETIQLLNDAQYDFLHLDVMDGSFYPDFLMGNKLLAEIRSVSSANADFHLMIEHPQEYIDLLDVNPADQISIHYELCSNVAGTLEKIKRKGCRVGLAIDAATPDSVLDAFYDKLDVIIVMLVNTGRAGNPFQAHCVDKIRRIKEKIRSIGREIHIEVDGSVHSGTIPTLKEAGAEIFVGGSSGLFRKDFPLSETVYAFKKIVYE
jgi:ribulose-phosphate 3-epimerase